MIKVKVFEEVDQGKDFYQVMGEFFAFREYAKEMGGWQFYNKQKSTWFLLYDGDHLVGFCSMFNERTHVFFDNFYIIKKHRGNGYSKVLFDCRLTYAKKLKKTIRTITDNPIQVRNYDRNGFIYYGNRGKYGKYLLENK